MRLLLDVEDDKAAFLLELLGHFRFVKKVTTLPDSRAELENGIQEAVEELKLVRQGKLEALNAESLAGCLSSLGNLSDDELILLYLKEKHGVF